VGVQALPDEGEAALRIADSDPGLLGEPCADADDTSYLPMFRLPMLVSEGTKEVMGAARERAVRREIPLVASTADLFGTGTTPRTGPR
jgi:hypothetical protein